MNELAGEFMYLGSIQFIREVKAGAPFGESSPMLCDIRYAPTLHPSYYVVFEEEEKRRRRRRREKGEEEEKEKEEEGIWTTSMSTPRGRSTTHRRGMPSASIDGFTVKPPPPPPPPPPPLMCVASLPGGRH